MPRKKSSFRTRNVPHPETGWGARKRHFVSGGEGKRYPKGPIVIGGHTLSATPKRPAILFLMDDLAEDLEPRPVFGMYHRGLIAKLLPWLRCERREILHVCSGGLTHGEGIRVDIRADARPDIVADGRALPLADGSMAAALIDPPYTEHYARELYGTDYPRPSHLLAEACRVVRPGGRIGIVHYIVPNPPAGARHVKTFGLSMGFGFPMRAVTIFERDHASLPGVG